VETRAREYLTHTEVEKLMKAAGENRNGHRDATMVLLAYRHGLRPVELVTLRWDAIDLGHGQIHVSRAKNGAASVHPLSGVELRALRRIKRDQEPPSPFVFTSERGAPFTTAGGATWWRGWASPPSSAFRRIRTCCGMPAVSSLPTKAPIHVRCKPISAIATFNTRCATPSCPLQKPLARLTPIGWSNKRRFRPHVHRVRPTRPVRQVPDKGQPPVSLVSEISEFLLS
jgi:hypothetical protein